MNIDIFMQKSSNLFSQNRLLKFTIVVLALAVIFNSLMVYRSVKYQRVVLIPPTMTGTVEFIQGKPTDSYTKDLCRRIVNLAATYSPPTARIQFEELLSYYAPEAYPEASKSWYSLASRVEDSQVSSVFYLEKIELSNAHIEVFGTFKQYAGDSLIENTGKTYVIDYRLQDGRLYILTFKEKFAQSQEVERG